DSPGSAAPAASGASRAAASEDPRARTPTRPTTTRISCSTPPPSPSAARLRVAIRPCRRGRTSCSVSAARTTDPTMGRHVATFWYLSAEDPAALFRSGVRSDPGFARRLLSRLHPTVTVASLGTFPLNRSASAGPGEIYIESFPGLTVVQTPIDRPVQLSTTDQVWLRLVEAPTVLQFSFDADTGVSGFGRWESGVLVRSFAAADDRIVEDEGMPLPFERPYWAGEFPLEGPGDNPLALPVSASALLHEAHRDWLGFDLERGGLDVPVRRADPSSWRA